MQPTFLILLAALIIGAIFVALNARRRAREAAALQGELAAAHASLQAERSERARAEELWPRSKAR